MNDTIVFKNPGVVPAAAFSTFGVSAKETDSPIGQFGTGLKYAIAVVLRHGGSISLWRGMEQVEFRVERESFRGKDIDVIYAGAERLPFTTHLGMNWQPWQAFRELYCNALDEAGTVGLLEDHFPEDGHTTVLVEEAGMAEAYRDREAIVLDPGLKPIYEDGNLAVYPGRSRYLYYRGVRAGEAEDNSAVTFSLKEGRLTEDRTFESLWSVQWDIAWSLSQNAPAEVLEKIFSNARGGFERRLDFSHHTPSSVFNDVVRQRLDARRETPDSAINAFVRSRPLRELVNGSATIELDHASEAELVFALDTVDRLGYGFQRDTVVVKEDLPGGIGYFVDSRTLYLSLDGWHTEELTRRILLAGIEVRRSCHRQSHAMETALLELVTGLVAGGVPA